ncbi:hypothetical protein [Bacillus weihaiensis]|uniref:hypothetical protein n=1 Tax=Bacillus weihaiensis TaxID=1547283 RepID=UPI002354BC21|nr:hypothetical protein [Bacillus weihaiensis]
MAQETVLLGSGTLLLAEGIDPTSATEEEIEAALVEVGKISEGASLTLENEFVEVRGGQKNQIIDTFQTNETVTFSTGICTWDLSKMSKFTSASYTEDKTTGKRRMGIGGLPMVKPSYLRFEHEKKDGFKIKINMFKAQNQAGLTLNFNNEDPSVQEYEFKLLADNSKSNGNLVEIVEEFEPVTP